MPVDQLWKITLVSLESSDWLENIEHPIKAIQTRQVSFLGRDRALWLTNFREGEENNYSSLT